MVRVSVGSGAYSSWRSTTAPSTMTLLTAMMEVMPSSVVAVAANWSGPGAGEV